MTWHNETEAAESLRRACGNLGDHETVTVSVRALLTLLRFAEEHSTCEADHEAAIDEAVKAELERCAAEEAELVTQHEEALEKLWSSILALESENDDLRDELRIATELVD